MSAVDIPVRTKAELAYKMLVRAKKLPPLWQRLDPLIVLDVIEEIILFDKTVEDAMDGAILRAVASSEPDPSAWGVTR